MSRAGATADTVTERRLKWTVRAMIVALVAVSLAVFTLMQIRQTQAAPKTLENDVVCLTLPPPKATDSNFVQAEVQRVGSAIVLLDEVLGAHDSKFPPGLAEFAQVIRISVMRAWVYFVYNAMSDNGRQVSDAMTRDIVKSIIQSQEAPSRMPTPPNAPNAPSDNKDKGKKAI